MFHVVPVGEVIVVARPFDGLIAGGVLVLRCVEILVRYGTVRLGVDLLAADLREPDFDFVVHCSVIVHEKKVSQDAWFVNGFLKVFSDIFRASKCHANLDLA